MDILISVNMHYTTSFKPPFGECCEILNSLHTSVIAVSAIADELNNIMRVGVLQYLAKVTVLRRQADREQFQVLATERTASLRLLCRVGGGYGWQI